MTGTIDSTLKESITSVAGFEGHGEFVEPANARASVAFVHGSGSARHSPHDRILAGILQEQGYATLLMDVLTPGEEAAVNRRGAAAAVCVGGHLPQRFAGPGRAGDLSGSFTHLADRGRRRQNRSYLQPAGI